MKMLQLDHGQHCLPLSNTFRIVYRVVRASFNVYDQNQRTIKPTTILVRPAKTQINLRIRAVWSESSLIAFIFYSLRAIQRGINPCHTGSMCRLIWVFSGHTDLIVGFVVHWLISRIKSNGIRIFRVTMCSGAQCICTHYENMPIQIYWKVYHQKMNIFRYKILIFFIFLLKT